MLENETLLIKRPGLKGKIGFGNKATEINIKDIVEVIYTPATVFINGAITFVTAGHELAPAPSDKNALVFTRKQAASIDELKAAIVNKLGHGFVTRKTGHAKFRTHSVLNGFYETLLIRKDLRGGVAIFDSGRYRARPTLTRIGAGAILLGPAGAVAGSLFMKNKSKNYVTIIFSDGTSVIIEGKANEEKAMRKFAAEAQRQTDF